jgi:hypothetical protein
MFCRGRFNESAFQSQFSGKKLRTNRITLDTNLSGEIGWLKEYPLEKLVTKHILMPLTEQRGGRPGVILQRGSFKVTVKMQNGLPFK